MILMKFSVCHSVTHQLRGGSLFSQATPPSVGVVKVIVEEASPGFVDPATPSMSAFKSGAGIVAWTRSAVGSFRLGQFFTSTPLDYAPDLFADVNSPTATSRTLCSHDKATVTNANRTLSSLLTAPYAAPATALAIVGGTAE